MGKNDMTKIFLSYASEDVNEARKLYAQLNSIPELDVWFDKESLKSGQDWEIEIRKAIHESRYFILLLSNYSKKKGFYQKEIRMALDIRNEYPEGEIFLIPVRLDNVEPHFQELNALHYVDMFPVWFDGVHKIINALNLPTKSLTNLIDFNPQLTCVLKWDGEKTTELFCSSEPRFDPTPAVYDSYVVWNDNIGNRIQFWKDGNVIDYENAFGAGQIGRPSIWDENIVWEQKIRGVPQRQILMLRGANSGPVVLSKEGDNITPSIFESVVTWCSSGNGGVFLFKDGQLTKLDNHGTTCSIYANNVAWQSKNGLFLFNGANSQKIAPLGTSFPSVFRDKVAYEFKGNIYVWNGGHTMQITNNGNNYIPYPWQRSMWEDQIVWRHSSEEGSHIYVASELSNAVEPIKISRMGINTDPSISNGNVVWSFKYNYDAFLQDQFIEFASQQKIFLRDLDANQRLKLNNEFSELDQELHKKFIEVVIERPWADPN